MPDLGRLTDDAYLCPSCFDGEHDCADLFNLPPFGLLACHCQRCAPY
jgi:hypothetical protein